MSEWRLGAKIRSTAYTHGVLECGQYPNLFPKGKTMNEEAQSIRRVVKEAVEKYASILVSLGYSLLSRTHSSDSLPRLTYVLPTRTFTRAQCQTITSFSDVWRLRRSVSHLRSKGRRYFFSKRYITSEFSVSNTICCGLWLYKKLGISFGKRKTTSSLRSCELLASRIYLKYLTRY